MTFTPQQLNAAIAELLGYRDFDCTTPPWRPLPGQTDTTAVHPVTKNTNYLPDWAGDIGAAWELLDKFAYWDIERGDSALQTRYRARLRVLGGEGYSVFAAECTTAPLAIACAFYYAMTGNRVEVANGATGEGES